MINIKTPFALIGLLCCPLFAAAPVQPNIIVILTDDMGWSDLGVQNVHQDLKTPNLDELAKGGARCTAGYITSPQCSPSRAAIITGCHQQRYGIDTIPDVPLPVEAVTLAERLGPVGYRCGFVGKWHLEPNHTSLAWMKKELPKMAALPAKERKLPLSQILRYSPAAQGFHEYFWGELKQYRANFALDGSDLQSDELVSMPEDFRIDVQTRAAVAFIERNHKKPFYLHVGYYGPHTPLEATRKYLDRFPGEMPERRRYALAMIAAIDDGVGEIISKLREHSLGDNTLIMFTSDNGAPLKISKTDSPIDSDAGGWDGSLNDPWIGEKGMLSEGGIRVPMIFYWNDRIPASITYRHPVSSLDFAATAIAAAGLETSNSLDGVNLLPYLSGKISTAPHEQLFWRFWEQAAIRDGRWKYVSIGKSSAGLFDLESDVHESKSLIAEQPERAAALRVKLEAWTNQFNPPGIPAKPLNEQEAKWYEHYFNLR